MTNLFLIIKFHYFFINSSQINYLLFNFDLFYILVPADNPKIFIDLSKALIALVA
jgi:hypothetical protein